MRKTILSAACLAITICITVAISCRKKNIGPGPSGTCSACISTPEANAANDNSSKGIYKGVIAGTSGTIKFDVMNSDSTLKAYIDIDGESTVLTANKLAIAGPLMATFTGKTDQGPASVTLTVSENGGMPAVTAMNIPGHPGATLSIVKETSSNLVKCYNGTYTNATTGKSGALHMVISTAQKVWIAQAWDDDAAQYELVGGTVDGNTIKFDDGNGISGSAILTDKKITGGIWSNSRAPGNGIWQATRTL